jgi:hypothetical protein
MGPRRSRRVRWVLIAVFGSAAFLLIAPLTLPRYPAVAPGGEPYTAAALAAQLDPSLLAEGVSDRTVVEIDWVEGCKPGPQAVAGLDAILEKYSPPNHPVEIVVDQEIPHAEWDEPSSRDRLIEKYAGVERANDPRTAWRYVLFAPSVGGFFGHSFNWAVTRGGVTIRVQGLVVSRSAHQRYALLWFDLDRLERMTLIHEFGHLFGLVGNPAHERSAPAHRRHCTNLHCVMAHPTLRVIASNFTAGLFNRFMTDYCADCQADIRRAQAYWTERRAQRGAD